MELPQAKEEKKEQAEKKLFLFTWMKMHGKQSGSSVELGFAKSHDSSSYFNPSKSIYNTEILKKKENAK